MTYTIAPPPGYAYPDQLRERYAPHLADDSNMRRLLREHPDEIARVDVLQPNGRKRAAYHEKSAREILANRVRKPHEVSAQTRQRHQLETQDRLTLVEFVETMDDDLRWCADYLQNKIRGLGRQGAAELLYKAGQAMARKKRKSAVPLR
jgi:hypothetical protein